MAQIIQITSEALQRTVRRLLPSQQGFGEDLQASNVIQPIIDLTPSAEGSEVRQDLQTALAFGSQTAHNVSNTTTTLINTPGFFRIYGAINVYEISVTQGVLFNLSDGLSNKKILEQRAITATPSDFAFSNVLDFTIFLRAGDSLTCTSTQYAEFVGSSRQIATVNGELVNPVGFTPQ